MELRVSLAQPWESMKVQHRANDLPPLAAAAESTHLGFLPFCAEQHVLIMLCHFRGHAFQLGCRELQRLQRLSGISLIQSLIDEPNR